MAVLALVLIGSGQPGFARAAPVPLAQYGAGGAGAGQLQGPSGVAIADSGEIWVAENFNQRISILAPGGGFVKAIGHDVIPGNAPVGFETCTTATGCKAGVSGGGAGQLFNPVGIAFSDAGELLVADGFNARTSVFGSSGTFLRAFGYDVIPNNMISAVETCTVATGCQVGLQGDNAGMLFSPVGVASDAAGNVFVTESINDRISVFSPAGTFIRAFGHDVIPGNPETGLEVCTDVTGCKEGAAGGSVGQLNAPRGLAFDPSGNLSIADTNNSRVAVFTPAGNFVRAFGHDVIPGNLGTGLETCTAGTGCKAGASGDGSGQLSLPQGLAFDAGGSLYAAEFFNRRVSVFGPGDSFLRAFGHDVIPGNVPVGFEVCTTATGCKQGAGSPATGALSGPDGVALDCRGGVWVADIGNARVARFGEPGTPLPPCSSGSDQNSCGGIPATISGTAGSDLLRGTRGRDIVAALAGKDLVRGLKGNDLVCGGEGRDRLIGGAGRDDLRGEAGRDVLKGGKGKDELRGGPGRDKLLGGPAKDKLRGGPGKDKQAE